MEEIEVPIEGTQEEIHHHAEHSRGTWISQVALASALLAVLAALASLFAGHHSNEAVIDQIQATDLWSQYQAKGIKASVLGSRLDLFEAMGKRSPQEEKDREKLKDYKKDQDEISERAKEREKMSEWHLKSHQIVARAVTMFQIAIAISAIAVLTRRKRFWWVGLVFGTLGVGFFIQGLMIPLP